MDTANRSLALGVTADSGGGRAHREVGTRFSVLSSYLKGRLERLHGDLRDAVLPFQGVWNKETRLDISTAGTSAASSFTI